MEKIPVKYLASYLKTKKRNLKNLAKQLNFRLPDYVNLTQAAKLIKAVRLQQNTTKYKRKKLNIKQISTTKESIPHKYKSPKPAKIVTSNTPITSAQNHSSAPICLASH